MYLKAHQHPLPQAMQRSLRLHVLAILILSPTLAFSLAVLIQQSTSRGITRFRGPDTVVVSSGSGHDSDMFVRTSQNQKNKWVHFFNPNSRKSANDAENQKKFVDPTVTLIDVDDGESGAKPQTLKRAAWVRI